MAQYYKCVDAKTVEDFEVQRRLLAALNLEMASYLDTHRWPYRTRIVKAWTSTYQHLGYLDTSTVEGTHAKTKSWIKSSKGDLLTVFGKLLSWWATAADSLQLQIAMNLVTTPHIVQGDLFSATARVISAWALLRTPEPWVMAHMIVVSRISRSVCKGTFHWIHMPPRNDAYSRSRWASQASTIRLRYALVATNRNVCIAHVIGHRQRSNPDIGQHATGYGVSSTRRNLAFNELLDVDPGRLQVGVFSQRMPSFLNFEVSSC